MPSFDHGGPEVTSPSLCTTRHYFLVGLCRRTLRDSRTLEHLRVRLEHATQDHYDRPPKKRIVAGRVAQSLREQHRHWPPLWHERTNRWEQVTMTLGSVRRARFRLSRGNECGEHPGIVC